MGRRHGVVTCLNQGSQRSLLQSPFKVWNWLTMLPSLEATLFSKCFYFFILPSTECPFHVYVNKFWWRRKLDWAGGGKAIRGRTFIKLKLALQHPGSPGKLPKDFPLQAVHPCITGTKSETILENKSRIQEKTRSPADF